MGGSWLNARKGRFVVIYLCTSTYPAWFLCFLFFSGQHYKIIYRSVFCCFYEVFFFFFFSDETFIKLLWVLTIVMFGILGFEGGAASLTAKTTKEPINVWFYTRQPPSSRLVKNAYFTFTYLLMIRSILILQHHNFSPKKKKNHYYYCYISSIKPNILIYCQLSVDDEMTIIIWTFLPFIGKPWS